MNTPDDADRDGMFTDPRILDCRDMVKPIISVVTCTWCGCIVADTEAHQQMHATTLTRRVE